jgi:hypothetical protein
LRGHSVRRLRNSKQNSCASADPISVLEQAFEQRAHDDPKILDRTSTTKPFSGCSLRGSLLELLDISLFNLAHQIAAPEEIASQVN